MSRVGSLLGLLGLLVGSAGCQPRPILVEVGNDDGCREKDDGESALGATRCSSKHHYFPGSYEVDVLFVIDNSGSMPEEQAKLSASMDAFVSGLEADPRGIDYRVAVTTTDNGNPWCGATTTPEHGAFQLSSCQGRAEEFYLGGMLPEDNFEVACTDGCALRPNELDELMRPTTTKFDDIARVRPWVESVHDETNLPDGVSVTEALSCFLPQGIVGCGFEQHLESMYLGLERATTEGEPEFGFIRKNAVLAVVIVTDEADCSHNPEFEEIFTADGGKVFWSDPESDYPTSAVCWNAGVVCSGGPGEYDECSAADRAVDGSFVDSESEAVMHPTSRYTDLLESIEDEKKRDNPEHAVLVAVIGGVPEGFSTSDLSGLYADGESEVYLEDFGIGRGCASDDGLETAVPPVRMREFADAFGVDNLSSVCSDNYSPAMAAMAQRVRAQFRERCFRECVEGTDIEKDGLQPNCLVEQEIPGESSSVVAECVIGDDGPQLPNMDADICFFEKTDASHSGATYDDMSERCIEDHFNWEFGVLRRAGKPAVFEERLVVECKLSETPTQDCPGLGG